MRNVCDWESLSSTESRRSRRRTKWTVVIHRRLFQSEWRRMSSLSQQFYSICNYLALRSRTMDVSVGVPAHPAKEKPPINVVGDVGGRIAIMVDDLIDDVQSFVAAAEVLKERGAYKIYVLATHGLLSSDAPRLIENSPIDEVVVTNTIPHEIQKMQCHKIKTIDISILLAEAIRRIHNKESMSYLFKNVTLED